MANNILLTNIQKSIEDNLSLLESGDIRIFEPEKYNRLSKRFKDILNDIASSAKIDSADLLSYASECAKLSAELEIYMNFEGGQEKAAEYQNVSIKNFFESFFTRLTKYNYKEVSREFNTNLNACTAALGLSADNPRLRSVVARFNYQVYKYKIEDLILDDKANIDSFIIYIIEDIKAILIDSFVSDEIKNRLQAYLSNINLLKSNFIQVIRLINIGLTVKSIMPEQLDKELNQSLYKESDLEKEYSPLNAEQRERFESFAFSNTLEIIARKNAILHRLNITQGRAKAFLENLFKYATTEEIKKFASELCYNEDYPYFRYGVKDNGYFILDIVDIFLKKGFTDFRYLFESLLQSNIREPMDKRIAFLFKLVKQLEAVGYDFSYEMDCAVIAQIDKLDIEALKIYIGLTNNEFLKRYFYKYRLNDLGRRQCSNAYAPSIDYTSVYHLVGSPDVKDYATFINDLQNIGVTEDVLKTIFDYFKTNVKYNYDELQVVKFLRRDSKKIQDIFEYVYQNRNVDSIVFKEMIIKLLDEAFMELEGRALTEKNKQEWFRNYGKVIHHEAQPARKSGFIKIPAREAYDEIIHIDAKDYPPVYENGLLKEGVCSAYVIWIKQICDALGIPCLTVHGRGTTSHVWNLIYIREKNRWVNFDMTMVRFYLDDWSKEYGEAEKWVFASNEEMFAMQPIRVVESIEADNGEVIFKARVTAENQDELTSFLESLQPGETPKM